MNCELCNGQGIIHGGCVVCAVCTSSVCTDKCPSPVPDFHGSHCRCHPCRQAVCTPDKAFHAKDKHKKNDPSACFPDLARQAVAAIDTGCRVYLHNSGADEPDPRPGKSDTMSDFLNLVTPGWRALEERVRALSPEDYVLEPWPGSIGGNNVRLRPSFFSEAMVDMVVALSFRSLGMAAAAVRGTKNEHLDRLPVAQQLSLPALAASVNAEPRMVNDASLTAWIPGYDALNARSQQRVVDYLVRAISISLPSDVESIVDMMTPAAAYA
jgi:hypothetical protein